VRIGRIRLTLKANQLGAIRFTVPSSVVNKVNAHQTVQLRVKVAAHDGAKHANANGTSAVVMLTLM